MHAISHYAGSYCEIGYPIDSDLKLKSYEISHDIDLSFFTEQDNDNVQNCKISKWGND